MSLTERQALEAECRDVMPHDEPRSRRRVHFSVQAGDTCSRPDSLQLLPMTTTVPRQSSERTSGYLQP